MTDAAVCAGEQRPGVPPLIDVLTPPQASVPPPVRGWFRCGALLHAYPPLASHVGCWSCCLRVSRVLPPAPVGCRLSLQAAAGQPAPRAHSGGGASGGGVAARHGGGGAPAAVSRAFPSWNRSILTEIYLCHTCSYQEIEDEKRPGRTAHAPTIARGAWSSHDGVSAGHWAAAGPSC
jgi:hypothetical protein